MSVVSLVSLAVLVEMALEAWATYDPPWQTRFVILLVLLHVFLSSVDFAHVVAASDFVIFG